MKRFLAAILAYTVITMGFAYPWHLIWFHDLYVGWGAVTRPDPIVPLGLLTIVLQGAVIAYLFPFYYRGEGSPIGAGLRFSFIIGTLIYSVMALATPAKFDINPVGAFIGMHTLFHLITTSANGIALGWIHRGVAQNQR